MDACAQRGTVTVMSCLHYHLLYRVPIHAASPKAGVVDQCFHHLRHLHIIWPIVAVY